MSLEPFGPHCIEHFPAGVRFDFAEIADEDETFRQMRDDYLAHGVRFNGYNIVLDVCSHGFGIPVHVLQSRQRGGGLALARAKLIAFSRVVSDDQPCVNTLMGIGRAFHRTHGNVVYCVKRYGPRIIAALEKQT